jgi:hypothetical protein
MRKSNKIEVREHSQEREWLKNMGNGSVLEGVRNLIEDAKERRSEKQLMRGSYSRRKKWSSEW